MTVPPRRPKPRVVAFAALSIALTVGAAALVGCGKPPAISVAPIGLDFGHVDVGAAKVLTFTVTNAGGATLAGSVGGVAAPFELVGSGTYALAAGESQAVEVRFAPPSAHAFEAVATLGGGGGAEVSLKGLGVPPSVSVSIDPAEAELHANDTLTITAAVQNASNTAVTWVASCGVITGTGLTITYQAPASATTCTVTATSVEDTDATATATISVLPPLLTVQGRLVMGPGVPVAGMLVHTQGHLVVSDGDGRFTLAGVAAPYALTVASTGSPPWAHVFDGLTVATPVLTVSPPGAPWIAPGGYSSAHVTGATPNANPLPPGQRLEVCVTGVDAVAVGCGTVGFGGDSYALDAWWWRPGNVDVRLHALLMQVDGLDRPTALLGYGVVPLTLVAGATTVQIAPSGAPPAAIALQGVLDVAGGGALQAIVVGVRVEGDVAVPVYLGQAPGATIDLVVPDLTPSQVQVAAFGTFPAGATTAWSLVDPSAPFTVALPAPPPLIAPVDGATAVTETTPFTVLGDADRVRQFTWQETGVADALTVRLVTRGTSVTLPDLTAVGLAWSAGGTYAWQVTEASATSVEAAASLDLQGDEMFFAYGVGMEGRGWMALTGQREVTLAP